MRDLAFIRTHQFGDNERKLYETLRLFFPEEAVVICMDESRGDVETGAIPKIRLDREIACRIGGGDLPEDWAWRMGDIAFARVREVMPTAERLWLIEPDVHVPAQHARTIFKKLADSDADYLACDFREHGHHPFNRALRRFQETTTYGGVFAFSRASARAVDCANALRRKITARLGAKPPRVPIPNDEAVVANAVVEAGFTAENLAELAPESFNTEWFSFNPPRLRRAVEEQSDISPRVIHPVMSAEELARKIMAPAIDGYSARYPRWRLRHVIPHLTSDERALIEEAWASSDRH